MSDDPNSIPLMESNSPPNVKPRKKRPNSRSNNALKTVVFVALVILVLILVAALIITLLKKCDSQVSPEPKSQKIPEIVRKNNSFWNNYDLPNFAIPNFYSVTFQLLKEAYNLEQHNLSNYFHGFVKINFTMISDSKFIVLNSKEITIKSIKIYQVSSNSKTKPLSVTKQILDDIFEQLILVPNESLKKFTIYSIEILYSGKITIAESGIIRTFYQNVKLDKAYDILYSKSEPIGARRIFPCFDEPDKKALFEVKIIHYPKYIALSNMPRLELRNITRGDLIFPDDTLSKNESIVESVFNTTFIYMSTYLLAFVLVEDYEMIQEYRKPNFKVAIWGPRGFTESGRVPLKYSISTENFFEKYLDFPSPLTKTDHVYIPNFLSGAMENWGVITYRENHLLMLPMQEEYISKKAYITIAHELAHIWFGNWLTMKTWKDLWLNEGFATYFASIAYLNQINLPLEITNEIFVYERRQILEKDGKSQSFPVKPKDINFINLFNSFIYYKGQAILISLQSIMGESNFRAGIQAYIKKYKESSPTTKQFFDEMQIYGPQSPVFTSQLGDFLEPWLNKIGYPVVTVNYDIDKKQIILSQKSITVNSTKNETWPIYISFKTDNSPLDSPILFQGQYFRKNLTMGNNEFILLNSDAKSYLRVNYSSFLWKKIIDNIKTKNININAINKIILFDDNLFFTNENLLDLSISKDLIDTLVDEVDIVPWTIFYNRIMIKMYDLFSDDKDFLKWSTYIKKLSKKALEKALKINFGGNLNIIEEVSQKQFFSMNCDVDNTIVLDILSNEFKTWISNPKMKNLPKHLVTLILHYGIRENDREEYWNKMWKMLINKNDLGFIKKDQIAVGLAGTSRPYRLNKILNYILTPKTHNSDLDKKNFVYNLVTWILQSNNGINVLRRWIVDNHKRIKKYAFGDNVPKETAQGHFQRLLSKIASTTYDLNVIRPLLPLDSNKMALTRIVMTNNQWRENIGKKLLKFI